MFKKSLTLAVVFLANIFLFQAAAWARTINVSGRGSERSFCNANSGYFCLDSIKRRSQDDAREDARRVCELNYRGRAQTYTASYSSFCNPNSLPPNHDGVWVRCDSTANMQCEVNN